MLSRNIAVTVGSAFLVVAYIVGVSDAQSLPGDMTYIRSNENESISPAPSSENCHCPRIDDPTCTGSEDDRSRSNISILSGWSLSSMVYFVVLCCCIRFTVLRWLYRPSLNATRPVDRCSRALVSPHGIGCMLTLAMATRLAFALFKAMQLPNFSATKDVGERALDRATLLLLIASFTLVLSQSISSIRPNGLPYIKRIFLTINIGIIVACGITLPQNGRVYEIQLLVISVLFLCLALSFCVIGLLLNQKLRGLVQSHFVKQSAFKIRSTSVVCVFFFTCRCVAWGWQPVTGCVYMGSPFFDEIVYPWLYFTIPESVNVLSMLYLLKPVNLEIRRGREDSWRPSVGSNVYTDQFQGYSPPDGRLLSVPQGSSPRDFFDDTI